MNKIKSCIVDQRDVARNYDFRGKEIIVAHPTLGRLLLEDGYGGELTLHGGAVRWSQGCVYHLDDNDTFDTLDSLVPGLDYVTVYQLMIHGSDNARVVAPISPVKLANDLGL